MGKLGKTVVDQIRALLKEGYNKSEVADQLGITRKTVAKYAVAAEPSSVPENNGNMGLPPESEITKLLFEMQGIMGTPTLLGAVQRACRDVISTARLRVTHWPNYSGDEGFSVGALIRELLLRVRDLEFDEKIYQEGYQEDRETIADLTEQLETIHDSGYKVGYNKASQDFAIQVSCNYCGKPIVVLPRSYDHRVISEMLKEHDWGHVRCANQARYDAERVSRELEAEMMR